MTDGAWSGWVTTSVTMLLICSLCRSITLRRRRALTLLPSPSARAVVLSSCPPQPEASGGTIFGHSSGKPVETRGLSRTSSGAAALAGVWGSPSGVTADPSGVWLEILAVVKAAESPTSVGTPSLEPRSLAVRFSCCGFSCTGFGRAGGCWGAAAAAALVAPGEVLATELTDVSSFFRSSLTAALAGSEVPDELGAGGASSPISLRKFAIFSASPRGSLALDQRSRRSCQSSSASSIQ
mmetsp:Transcript_18990/g.40399  ORF Transcript_18990/g.40399 Transcript_18990/m.40399 type:complete len:238 (+) Transcript_18990:1935-2648(+)